MSKWEFANSVRADIGVFGWWFRYKIAENAHSLDFDAYPVAARCMDGTEEFMIGDELTDGLTPLLPKAKPKFSGYLKWDGCVEFYFEQEHMCGKEGVEEFCHALMFIHSLCLHIPKVDKKCAGYE